MSFHKSDTQQARANVLKTVRAAIRLKHSIAADEELNELLPRIQEIFDKAAQTGRLLDPTEVQRALARRG